MYIETDKRTTNLNLVYIYIYIYIYMVHLCNKTIYQAYICELKFVNELLSQTIHLKVRICLQAIR